eukprot:10917379-Ditylum_brightwellii.AAC.1
MGDALLCIINVERYVYGAATAKLVVVLLQETLNSLELLLDLEPSNVSIDLRIKRLEKCFLQHAAYLEKDVYKELYNNRKESTLEDRLEGIQKELGVEGDGATQLSKIVYLEKSTKGIKDCMNELDMSYLGDIDNKDAGIIMKDPLSRRVRKVKEELDLAQEEYPMSERILMIKNSFCERIRKLKHRVYT